MFGINFKVDDLIFVKDSTAEFFGEIIPVKVFRVKAKIRLQGDYFDMTGIIDSTYAYFNFIVGHDSSYSIHDKFVKTAYEYWKGRDALNKENYDPYPDYGIYYYDGDYILFDRRMGYLQWSPYTIWYLKRIIRINFVIQEGELRNVLSEDLMTNLSFSFEGSERFIYETNQRFFPPDDFMRLYDGGKFKKRRWLDSFFEEYKDIY